MKKTTDLAADRPWDECEVLHGVPYTVAKGIPKHVVPMSADSACVAMVTRLKPIHTMPVMVCGQEVMRDFHPVRWRDADYYAECRTGTLYHRGDGTTSSPWLRLA